MKTALIAIALAAIAAPAPLALAQRGDTLANGPVSREEAIAIARDKGMARIHEVERDDGKWELEGCTADRREIEVDIRRSTGEIVKLDIDDDRDDDDC